MKLLQPRNFKFKKTHKGRISKGYTIKPSLYFGNLGIYLLDNHRITAKQLISSKTTILKTLKKYSVKYPLFMRVFPNVPVSKKPAEVRMGNGKGSIDHWVSRVKSNQMVWEILAKDIIIGKRALKAASYKLPSLVGYVYDDTKNI